MSHDLYAWNENCLVGKFSEENGNIAFHYSAEAARPISLSLPLDESWDENAPRRFLEGLFPDQKSEREAMRATLGATSRSVFELLNEVDVTGGLRFTTSDCFSALKNEEVNVADNLRLREKVQAMRLGTVTSWQNPDGSNRFALAGSQGKFALAQAGDAWGWVDVSHPSTHIIKPDSPRFPGMSLVEHATMKLAKLAGIPVAKSSLVNFDGEVAYAVERFDRIITDRGTVGRRHIEDLTQALGLSRDEKYSVTVEQVASLLHRADPSGRLLAEWFNQLIFNILSGNCDAHGKNYSLFIGENRVGLCPLYDCVCTTAWPELADTLAMSINGKGHARELGLSDWSAQAAMVDLPQTDTVKRVAEIAAGVAFHLDEATRELPEELGERVKGVITENNKKLFDELSLIDEKGRLAKKPLATTATFTVYPEELKPNQLLNSVVESIEDHGATKRVHLKNGIPLPIGQKITSSYIEVPAHAILASGRIEMPSECMVNLFDEHLEMEFDTAAWDDLCSASRDEWGKQGILNFDGSRSRANTPILT